MACTIAHSEPVSFVVKNVKAQTGTLIVAFFRPGSPEWGQRFKHADKADLLCKHPLTQQTTETTMSCDLPPSQYVGLAFVDTDNDGTLTHGLFGPSEQFGLTGIEQAIRFPPEPQRTVIDTGARKEFVIVLN